MSNYNDAQGVAKECREASAAMTDNTSHGNRAQDAR